MHTPLFVLDTSENRPPRKRHRCDAPSDAYAWQWESRNPAPAAARPPGASTHMVLPLPLSNGRRISFQAFAGGVGSEACAVAVRLAPRPAASPPAKSKPAIRRILIRSLSWMSVRSIHCRPSPCSRH